MSSFETPRLSTASAACESEMALLAGGRLECMGSRLQSVRGLVDEYVYADQLTTRLYTKVHLFMVKWGLIATVEFNGRTRWQYVSEAWIHQPPWKGQAGKSI